MTHPMDSVPMPEPTFTDTAQSCSPDGVQDIIEYIGYYTADQLRSYGLSTYEIGRNEGLEEAAKVLKQHGYSEGAIDAIRSLKR